MIRVEFPASRGRHPSRVTNEATLWNIFTAFVIVPIKPLHSIDNRALAPLSLFEPRP